MNHHSLTTVIVRLYNGDIIWPELCSCGYTKWHDINLKSGPDNDTGTDKIIKIIVLCLRQNHRVLHITLGAVTISGHFSYTFSTFPPCLSKQEGIKVIYNQSPPTGSRQKSDHINGKGHLHIMNHHSLTTVIVRLYNGDINHMTCGAVETLNGRSCTCNFCAFMDRLYKEHLIWLVVRALIRISSPLKGAWEGQSTSQRMDCCWNTGCWCFSWVQLTCRLLQGLIVTFLLEPSRTKGSLTTGWKENPLFLLGLVILRATDHHCLKAASALLNPHLLLCPSANPETFLGDHWRYCTFGLICS